MNPTLVPVQRFSAISSNFERFQDHFEIECDIKALWAYLRSTLLRSTELPYLGLPRRRRKCLEYYWVICSSLSIVPIYAILRAVLICNTLNVKLYAFRPRTLRNVVRRRARRGSLTSNVAPRGPIKYSHTRTLKTLRIQAWFRLNPHWAVGSFPARALRSSLGPD